MTRDERDDDEIVRQALRDLNGADAPAFPSYERVLAHGEQRGTLPHSSATVRFVLAGVLIAAMLAGYRALFRVNRLTVPPEVVALSTWRAPTDALFPDSNILAPSTPNLNASILDFTALTRRLPQ